MSTVKKMIRKGHKPLKQIGRRYAEHENVQNASKVEVTTKLVGVHYSGPIT